MSTLQHSGFRTRTRRTSIGWSLSRVRGSQWLHPWQTQPAWDAEREVWTATVRPGFVNGECPSVTQVFEEASRTGRDFGKNPLSGEDYFSAWVFRDR